MAIYARETKVSTNFPAACLYLDDVAEIQKIILDVVASRRLLKPGKDLTKPPDREIETEFYVGDRFCTEIQDLPKMGKRTSDFEIRVAALDDDFTAILGMGTDGIEWSTTNLSKADEREVVRQIETVFKRRKGRNRRLLKNIPCAVGTHPRGFTRMATLEGEQG